MGKPLKDTWARLKYQKEGAKYREQGCYDESFNLSGSVRRLYTKDDIEI